MLVSNVLLGQEVVVDNDLLRPVPSMSNAGNLSATQASGLSSGLKVGEKEEAKKKVILSEQEVDERNYKRMIKRSAGMQSLKDHDKDLQRSRELCSSPRTHFSWEEMVKPTIAVYDEIPELYNKKTMKVLGISEQAKLKEDRQRMAEELRKARDEQKVPIKEKGLDIIPDEVFRPPEKSPSSASPNQRQWSAFVTTSRSKASSFQMRIGIQDGQVSDQPSVGHYRPKYGVTEITQKAIDFGMKPKTVRRATPTLVSESSREDTEVKGSPAKDEGEEGDGEEDMDDERDAENDAAKKKKKGEKIEHNDPEATSAFKSKTKSCLELEMGIHVRKTEAPDKFYYPLPESQTKRHQAVVDISKQTDRPGIKPADDRVYDVVDCLYSPSIIYRNSSSPGPKFDRVADRAQRNIRYKTDNATIVSGDRFYECDEEKISTTKFARWVCHSFDKCPSREERPIQGIQIGRKQVAPVKEYNYVKSENYLRKRQICKADLDKQLERKQNVSEGHETDQFIDTQARYCKINFHKSPAPVNIEKMNGRQGYFAAPQQSQYLLYNKAPKQWEKIQRRFPGVVDIDHTISRDKVRDLQEKHQPKLLDKEYNRNYSLQTRRVVEGTKFRDQVSREVRAKVQGAREVTSYMEPIIEYKPNEQYTAVAAPIPAFNRYSGRDHRPASIRDIVKTPYPLAGAPLESGANEYYEYEASNRHTKPASPGFIINDPEKRRQREAASPKKGRRTRSAQG